MPAFKIHKHAEDFDFEDFCLYLFNQACSIYEKGKKLYPMGVIVAQYPDSIRTHVLPFTEFAVEQKEMLARLLRMAAAEHDGTPFCLAVGLITEVWMADAREGHDIAKLQEMYGEMPSKYPRKFRIERILVQLESRNKQYHMLADIGPGKKLGWKHCLPTDLRSEGRFSNMFPQTN